MKKARTSGLTKSATPVLAELLETYQEATKVDKIKGVTMQVDEVKEAMQNNITAALKVRSPRNLGRKRRRSNLTKNIFSFLAESRQS